MVLNRPTVNKKRKTNFTLWFLCSVLLTSMSIVTQVHSRATLELHEKRQIQDQEDDKSRGIVFGEFGNNHQNSEARINGGLYIQVVTTEESPKRNSKDEDGTVLTVADFVNILEAAELYVQREETKLVKNLELFRHTLLTLLRFHDVSHKREKRQVNTENNHSEQLYEIQNKLRDIDRKKAELKSGFNTFAQDGNQGESIGDGNHPLRDFREKIAMKLVKDNSGTTSVDLNYAFETLDLLGRYRRDTTDVSNTGDTAVPVATAVFLTILLLAVIAGLIYLGVYLCKKHKACTQCYDGDETPLLAFRASKGKLLNLPRFAVTSTDGRRRSFESVGWNFGNRKATSWRRSTLDLFQRYQLGGLEKSVSFPNLNQRRDILDGLNQKSIASFTETMPRRTRKRSLSESDREMFQQPSPAARMMLLKAQRKHRSHLARIKREQRLSTIFPGHSSGNESSGDSGFSTPTSSRSRCSRHSQQTNYTVHHHHHYHHHHQGPCCRHEGCSRAGSEISDHTIANTPVGMSTVSLGSTLSHASTAVSSFTTIPGQIEY